MRTCTGLAAAAVVALTAAACVGGSGRTHPPPESQAAAAVPIGDPSARTTPRDVHRTPGIERVTVKVTRAPGGGIKVLEFLSPDLTNTEKDELRDAIERGEARPEYEPERPVSTWTTTVIRHR